MKGEDKTAGQPGKISAGAKPEGKRGKADKDDAPVRRRRRDVPRYAESIINSSLAMIIAVDKDRRIIEFNKSAQEIFGYSEAEILGRSVDILYDDPHEGLKVNEAVSGTGEFVGEIMNRRKNGSAFRTFLAASVLHDPAGSAVGFMGISRDITDIRNDEEAVQKSERFLSTIFDSIKDPFCIIGKDYRIVRVNEAYAQMRNKMIVDMVGKRCHEILQNRIVVCDDCVVKKTFDSADPCAKDKKLTLPDGTQVWMEIYTYPIVNEAGAVSHVIEYTRDITDRRKAEEERRRLIEKLEYLSSIDGLTALLNRRALIDRLNYEVDRANRYGSELSLMLCDIDYLKEINDTYGHAEGDRALQIISEILRDSLRKTDIIGRYGGDEFMIILPETSLRGAEDFAERIRFSVENTGFQIISGKSIRMSLSLGVTSFKSSSDDADINALIKRADTALYNSKRTGRNKVCTVKA